jgi:diguanylate cyclase (GGDEF)-like protein
MQLISTERPLNLLLIEDNKGDAILTERVLKNTMLGAVNISRTESLAATLKILGEDSFDIALLDRSLPDSEGFDGLYSIQNIAPQLPIIFLTAYKDEKTAFEAIEQGAQDYLFKDTLDGHSVKRAIQYAILRKQFESILIMRANFDMLTGLANRMLFESRLDMALAKMKRHGGNIAVLFLDLDRFKQVNDMLGHAAGDQLLKEVGKRLKQALRHYDTAARFGGDEFAVLLEGMPNGSHAAIVVEKIISILSAPFEILGQTVGVGVSIGIAGCSSEGSMLDSETIMKRADAAMYEAKSESGNGYRFYVGGKSDLAKITKTA